MGGLTNELIKEELSICYVHALAAQSGISVDNQRIDNDSVDVTIKYNGKCDGWPLASPSIGIQLKATANPKFDKEGNLKFSLPIKNYRDLSCNTQTPRILIVLLLNNAGNFVRILKTGLSIDGLARWISLQDNPIVSKAKTSVTVTIPASNTLTIETLMRMIDNVGRDQRVTAGL